MYIPLAWINFFCWLAKPFLAKNKLESSVKNFQVFTNFSMCMILGG